MLHDRTDGVYLLPASTQFETYGSVTASNRSLQWREKVVDPLFESLPDHVIMYKLAKKFGWADRIFKKHQGEMQRRECAEASRGHHCASSTGACGPLATPVSHRSA